jgi:hypothetical protein
LVTGVCSFGIIAGIGALLVHPGDDVVEPLALIFGGIVFVIVANACYTLGWITELLWSGGDTARTEGVRQTVYRRGMIFSVMVTAAPGLLIPLAWLRSKTRLLYLQNNGSSTNLQKCEIDIGSQAST